MSDVIYVAIYSVLAMVWGFNTGLWYAMDRRGVAALSALAGLCFCAVAYAYAGGLA